MVRRDNQDNFFVSGMSQHGQILAVVADGVGGYSGGDEAARLAVTVLPQQLRQLTDRVDADEFITAVIDTHNAIYDARGDNPGWYSMCCVWTAVLFDTQRNCMHISHVGDTRLYAFSGNRLIKLSKDHSYVGRLEEQGVLSEADSMRHPERNVIDRVAAEFPLAAGQDYYQTVTLPMGHGITWLLCSDGLYDMINSACIIDILSGDATTGSKVKALIDVANRAGGRDNVTVVLVEDTTPATSDTANVMQAYSTYASSGYTHCAAIFQFLI
jgi:serine/threonine protein phosphatase PrpC